MSCEVADGAARRPGAAAVGRRPPACPSRWCCSTCNMPGIDGYELAGGRSAPPRAARHAPGAAELLGRCAAGAPEEAALRRRARQAGAASRGSTRRSRRSSPAHAPPRRASERPRRPTLHRRGAIPRRSSWSRTAINQAVAAHMLERCGFEAQVAENGRRGAGGAVAADLRRRADGLPDARARRLRGDARDPPPRAGRTAHADHRDDRQRDAGRARALPRRRHGRLPDQAAAPAHAQGHPVALGRGSATGRRSDPAGPVRRTARGATPAASRRSSTMRRSPELESPRRRRAGRPGDAVLRRRRRSAQPSSSTPWPTPTPTPSRAWRTR